MIRSGHSVAAALIAAPGLLLTVPAATAGQAAVAVQNQSFSEVNDTCRGDSNPPLAASEALALLQTGWDSFRRADFNAAISAFTKAVTLDPASDAAYTARGLAKLNVRDDAGAAADFTKANSLNPANGTNDMMLGAIKQRAGDAAGAKHDYIKAAEKLEGVAARLPASSSVADPTTRISCLSVALPLYRADKLNDSAKLERTLQQLIDLNPAGIDPHFELGRLYELRGSQEAAERTFLRATGARPADSTPYMELAAYYARQKQPDKAIEQAARAAERAPTNPEPLRWLGTYCFVKVFEDSTLDEIRRRDYIRRGREAADKALAIDPNYAEPLTLKALLVRLEARLEIDSAKRDALTAEASALENQARQLLAATSRRKEAPVSRAVGMSGGAPGGIPGGAGGIVGGLPAAPPPAPAPNSPIRVGKDIKEPVRIKDVPPVYPKMAQQAKIQGVVVLEAIIGKDGSVKEARVLRPVPMLDQAALDAVRQWKYTPTLLAGQPVEVIMTITVTFTLR